MNAFHARLIRSERAVTLPELVLTLGTLAVLAAFAFPLVATTRHDSDRAGCLNNLRQMGRAAMMWAGDHGDQFSWHTLVSEGGTLPAVGLKAPNAWFEYQFLSNELATPRILACPADDVTVARDFEEYATSPSLRASATSYLINVHPMLNMQPAPLFADRNLRLGALTGLCPLVRMNVNQISAFDPNVGWTNAVHGFEGNHVTTDGSVFTTTSGGIRSTLGRSDVNGVLHLLRAR